MRYGIPYRGSKSRIAPWVVSHLPAAPVLVDLFAGGCAVTHCALLSGKWPHVVANDLTDAPEVFRDSIFGEYDGYSTVHTREEFKRDKDWDMAEALLYSFGNNTANYLWGPRYEGVKAAASRMVSAPSTHERRMAYKAFCRELKAFLERPEAMDSMDSLGKLQGLQGLERMQGLEGLQGLQGLEISRASYDEVVIPQGACVYADPPYRWTGCTEADGTACTGDMRGMGGGTGGFDSDAFDAWLARVPFPVYVSEFTAPAGCVEIASTERKASMSVNGKTSRQTERLFVQERFAAKAVDE